jgi:hypothetical protein
VLGELADQQKPQTFDVRAMTPELRQAAIARTVEAHPGLAALTPRSPGVRAEP